MTVEKCINEFGVDDVIFEEGSTGRELLVVLEGQVEIAKMNGANKTVIVTPGHRDSGGTLMLRDDFSMLRKMFNEPNVPINVDIWLEEGNLIDLGNFRLNVMYTPGHTSACITLFEQDKGLLFAADTLMPGGVMGGVFGSGSIADYIQSLERLKGLNSKILLSGHGRLSHTPQDDVGVAIQRSHTLLSDTAQLFDALDARSNFEPIMQSVRDLNKLDDG